LIEGRDYVQVVACKFVIFSRMVATIAAARPGAAVAQTATGQSQGVLTLTGADSSGGLETLVVTARKRAENIQDVPVAVTAIEGADLDSNGTSQVQQLQFQAPSLVINTPTSRQTSFAIRGLGNNAAADGLSASVGLYIDGVYLDRPGMAISIFSTSIMSRCCVGHRALCLARTQRLARSASPPGHPISSLPRKAK
jgi:outer membrane receptor protein involved in Fe transport